MFKGLHFESLSMRRSLLALLFILVFTLTARAQVSSSGLNRAEDLSRTVYGLGFSAGPASGVGASFRAHLPSKSSFQAVLGIIKTKAKMSMTVGGEYQYDLVRSTRTRFFFAGAAAYFYSGNGSNEVAGPFRLGAGLGGEFNIREGLHVTLEGLFTYSSDATILPLPQVALHYYFF